MSDITMKECGIFDLGAEFLNFSIDATHEREALCFAESLLICTKHEPNSLDIKSVGGYCISIDKIGRVSREFLVNVAASMEIEAKGLAGRSKIVGSVDENFQCLEEKRTECRHGPGGKHEKLLNIRSEDDFYHVDVEAKCPCDSSSSKYVISMKNHPRFMSEAGNVLLMRYLAITNYHGSFILESMTIDGKIETCDYRCTSTDWKKLDGRWLEVYSVERRKHEEPQGMNADTNERSTEVRETKSLLTRQGRILRHEWLNLSYVLRINPLVDPLTIEVGKCPGIGRSLRQTWPDSLELMSEYLVKKSRGIASHSNYFENHPEIGKLLTDYTQALLIGKSLTPFRRITIVSRSAKAKKTNSSVTSVQPVDVIGFTIQHFKTFAISPE